jgi:hypothetical protein
VHHIAVDFLDDEHLLAGGKWVHNRLNVDAMVERRDNSIDDFLAGMDFVLNVNFLIAHMFGVSMVVWREIHIGDLLILESALLLCFVELNGRLDITTVICEF